MSKTFFPGRFDVHFEDSSPDDIGITALVLLTGKKTAVLPQPQGPARQPVLRLLRSGMRMRNSSPPALASCRIAPSLARMAAKPSSA
jgi:hypothetical protein